jgi:hypothetical protein
MLHACFYTICLVFYYTLWHFFAFSRTNLLTFLFRVVCSIYIKTHIKYLAKNCNRSSPSHCFSPYAARSPFHLHWCSRDEPAQHNLSTEWISPPTTTIDARSSSSPLIPRCRALFLSPWSPQKTETDGDTRRVCADLYPFKLQRFRRQVPHPGLHISQQSVMAFTLPMRSCQEMTRPVGRDQKSQRRHHDYAAGQTQGSVSRTTTLQIAEPCCYWSWFDLSFPCVSVLHFLKYPRKEFHPLYKVSS